MKKRSAIQSRFIFVFVLFLSCSCYAQWNQLTQDTNNLNCSVFFINPDTGFVSGDYNFQHTFIQRTTDGGQTWDSTLITNGPMAMSIYFADDTIGYCGGQNGAVYKTVNMGQNWFFAGFVAPQNDFGTLYFINKDTGFVADFHGRIFRTTNGAASWTVVSAVQNSFQNFYPGTGKFQFINDSTGFVANGNYGAVQKTIDYGTTWMPIDLPSGNTWAMAIYMFNKDTGIVTAEGGKVWKTANGGTTWTGPQMLIPYDDLLDITFFNDSIGYIVGGENNNYIFHPPLYPPVGAVIYVTKNGGSTWSIDTSFCCDWFTSICNAGNNVGYAAGWHGWLFKINNALSLTAVTENKLEQHIHVYPNPASEQIYFPRSSQIVLLDLSGRIIASAENETQLNVQQVAEGIYILVLETNDVRYSEKITIRR